MNDYCLLNNCRLLWFVDWTTSGWWRTPPRFAFSWIQILYSKYDVIFSLVFTPGNIHHTLFFLSRSRMSSHSLPSIPTHFNPKKRIGNVNEMGVFGAPAESTIQCGGCRPITGGGNGGHVQEKPNERTQWQRRTEQRNLEKAEGKGRCIPFYRGDRHIFG
jgi:hypothetical protein